MKKITYCVGIHVPFDLEFVEKHMQFVEDLKTYFDVSLIFLIFVSKEEEKNFYSDKAKFINVKNWGGPIGLLDQMIEMEEPLGDFIMITEADVFILSKDHFKNITKILTDNPVLAYLGHVYSDPHMYKKVESKCGDNIFVKYAESMSEYNLGSCYFTDGGYHVFRRENLLLAKEKLGVLPGFIDRKNRDVPLEKDSDIDFRERKKRIIYHEVGFPSRMHFHGFKFAGIINHDVVSRAARAVPSPR